jgi:hypothetical protein
MPLSRLEFSRMMRDAMDEDEKMHGGVVEVSDNLMGGMSLATTSLGTLTSVRYTPSSASYLVGSGGGSTWGSGGGSTWGSGGGSTGGSGGGSTGGSGGGSTWGTVADANLVSYSSSGDSKRCGNLEATIRSAILAIQNCPDPVDATNVALEILKKGLEA